MSTPDQATYDAVRTRAGLFDNSDHGTLELTSADAGKFLQNLCTNDILNLAVGSGCEAFFCTAKAKVVAYVHIYRMAESYMLDTPPGTHNKLLQHLDRHLVCEQVALHDHTGDFSQFHLAGPESPALLAQVAAAAIPALADHQHARLKLGNATCFVRRHDPLGLSGYDILCLRPLGKAVKQALLDAGAQPADAATYNLLRIEAGTPQFGVDIDEERFVVEVGRIKQAICYTKGCYLGQEPIVMARDRGHVNRMLMGMKLSGEGTVAAGTKLLRDGSEVGQVTSSVVSPRLGVIGLAYLRRGSWEAGTTVQVEGQERLAQVVALPFGD
jgi:folate-binding protein YgfZ